MEFRDVRLRVEVDFADAAARTDGLSTAPPPNPGGPRLPGAPTPDAGAGSGTGVAPAAPTAPREPGRAPETAAEQVADVIEGRFAGRIESEVRDEVRKSLGDAGVAGGTALGLFAAAKSGSLSSQLIGAIPFGNLLKIGVDYGPAVSAAVEEVVPEPLRPLAKAARQSTEAISRTVASVRSYLDAGGAAIDATSELAAAQAQLFGRTDAEFLGRYAWAKYSIQQQMLEADEFRRIYGREKMGAAAGSVIEDVVTRLRAGLGGAVGR